MNKTSAKKSLDATQRSGSFHMTRKTDYGLLLLSLLAAQKPNEHISIKTISEQSNIPFFFLQKIARALQGGGIIKSERGKYGGHKLARTIKEITLKEVVESLEGPIKITKCADGDNCACSCSKSCNIKTGMRRVNDEIKQYLLSKTLDNFLS